MKAFLILTIIIGIGLIISGCSKTQLGNSISPDSNSDNSADYLESAQGIEPDIGELDDIAVSDDIPQ